MECVRLLSTPNTCRQHVRPVSICRDSLPWSAAVPPLLTVPLLPRLAALAIYSPSLLPCVTAVPPYRRSYSAAPPPTRTHLTSCSTEFAMRSDPSRRVPRREVGC